MTNTFKSAGAVLAVVLTAAAEVGDPVVRGDVVGLALMAGGIGDEISVAVGGRHVVAKATGTAWEVGDRVSWDNSASAFGVGITSAAGDVIGAGFAAAPAAAGATVGEIVLANPGTRHT